MNIKTEEINKLIDDINNNAKEKGFWDVMDNVLRKMENSRHPKKDLTFHVMFSDTEIEQTKKAFISQKLMLMVSEIGEALESDRKSKYSDWVEFLKTHSDLSMNGDKEEFCFKEGFDRHIKDTFEDELADTVIRLFDLCKKLDIDIMKQVMHKHKYNKTRKKLHGKEY